MTLPGPALRLLVVKTSSMGDLVHALPAVSDILRARPGSRVDWLAEPAFAAIPRLHPGVGQVHLLAWRKWRRQLLQPATWKAMAALARDLRQAGYDQVLDLQGLVKSAWWARRAGAPVAGYDRASAREGAAAWAYTTRHAVARDRQAVARCRALAAAALGYETPTSPPDFGLVVPAQASPWSPAGPHAVLIPNASRPEKHWPQAHWVAVGQALRQRGFTPVVLWGNAAEQALAEAIARGCDGEVPPFLKVGEMAAVLAGARQVVGLDTGFTHLAAALGRPTVGIYCDHSPGLAGLAGPGPLASIGGVGQRPALAEVLGLVQAQWEAAVRA